MAGGCAHVQPVASGGQRLARVKGIGVAKLDMGAFEALHKTITAAHDEFVMQMEAAGIPIVSGVLSGAGAAVVSINAETEFSQVMRLVSAESGSIAVVSMDRSTRKGFEHFNAAFSGCVRQGATSTWFVRSVDNGPLEEGRDYDGLFDEEADDEPQQPTEEVSRALSSVALVVASMEGFGRLKNKAQRQEMTAAMLGLPAFSEVSSHYVGEIAQRAESLYEHGVLPQRASAMAANGQSAGDIAKALGVTRPRIERALSAQVPEHIRALLAEDPSAAKPKAPPPFPFA